MSSTVRRTLLTAVAILAIATFSASRAQSDEIRLKDGRKLYGVIVSYDDNMFKVKTDFGYVLVEKDKIASIIPDASPTPANAKTSDSKPSAAPSDRDSAYSTPSPEAARKEKAASILTNTNARPEIPATRKSLTDTNAPPLKATAVAPRAALATATPPPPPPKEEPPDIREEVQGNLYINHQFAFRMYKAPSWQLIEGAGQTLPNAIVAMGTSNESTLLVVGHEKSKEPLNAAAQAVESRLHDAYDNYRLVSQRNTLVGGHPAVEYRYRGMADDHDWSGMLSVVSRSGEFLTVLGMTYGDSDLIQIQENVIARAIASLDFNVK